MEATRIRVGSRRGGTQVGGAVRRSGGSFKVVASGKGKAPGMGCNCARVREAKGK